MKLLAVVGSPRKRGNTDLLMDQVINGAQDAGAEVQRVFLHGMKIAPCDGCGACKKTGVCNIEDDMSLLYDALYESDVWALGTPVYWWGASAQMKTFIDRWYVFCHQPWNQKVKGKRVILVSPFGDDDLTVADPLVAMLDCSLDYLDMEFFRKVLVVAGDKGVVAKDEAALREAFQAGRDAFKGLG